MIVRRSALLVSLAAVALMASGCGGGGHNHP